ncbi:MAG: hypothetical protein QF464_15110, partial [Myxococcota bacterium]|nr:hypothetical protein [Myxococcota bacterium]
MALPRITVLSVVTVLVAALAVGGCASSDGTGAGGDGALPDGASGPGDQGQVGDAGGADSTGPSDVDPGGGGDGGGASVDGASSSDGGSASDDATADAVSGDGTSLDLPDGGSVGSADGGGASPDVSPDAGLADASVPEEPSQAGFPGFEMMIKIASPGAGLGAQVIGAKTTVAGILFGDAEAITWEASSGASGEIFPGSFWTSGPIDLDIGDNVVTVTATLGDEVETDSITITYNPVFRFDDRPLARPNIVWAGASTPVVFTVPVSLYPNFDEDTVSLLEVDAGGGEVANLGQMMDNGATASVGDEIESDGVFTKKVTINCSGTSHKHFRVSVQARKGQEWYT